MSTRSNSIDTANKLFEELNEELSAFDTRLCDDANDMEAAEGKANALGRMVAIANLLEREDLMAKFKDCLVKHRDNYPAVNATMLQGTPEDMFAYAGDLEDYVTDLVGLLNNDKRFMNAVPKDASQVCDDKVRRKFSQVCDKVMQASKMSTPLPKNIPTMGLVLVAYSECDPTNKSDGLKDPKVVVLTPHPYQNQSEGVLDVMDVATQKFKSVVERKLDAATPHHITVEDTKKNKKRTYETSFVSEKSAFIESLFGTRSSEAATAKRASAPDSRKRDSWEATLDEDASSDSDVELVEGDSGGDRSSRAVRFETPPSRTRNTRNKGFRSAF